jgi:hypothetical protein
VALLRLLLLLLLPALREPGLGVAGAAGAGLPESVIWAVNAGGEAHVDVHGIHFRKDPLEGRVGRGESAGPAVRCGAQPASGLPRAPASTPGPRLCRFLGDLARSQDLALVGRHQEPSRQRVGEKLYLDPSCRPLPSRGSKGEGGLSPLPPAPDRLSRKSR